MITSLRQATLFAALLALACAVFAEDGADEASGCEHTTASVPKSIQDILKPLYTGSPSEDGLSEASKQLETLMSQANYCRIFVVQDSGGRSEARNRDNMEWKSLNQWLVRLTNFVTLNAKGHKDRDWKDEYEMFVEVYELEI